MAPECVDDEQCPGATCEEGRCTTEACSSDEDCPGGSCAEGRCVLHECVGDEDCMDGSCVENACVEHECISSRDCPDGRCVDNACVPYECRGDDDCEGGSCVRNACVPYECVGDEDCPGGSCVENVCEASSCTGDEDCPDGSCVENLCEPYECVGDEDCPGGTCVEDLCEPYECVGDEDCPGGSCVENSCEPHACVDDGDCPGGSCVEKACEPYECVGDEECPGGSCVENVCEPYECVGDEDCPDGGCVENACEPYECVGDEDCPGGSCVENACEPYECVGDEDCPGGSCVENACVAYECVVDSDCTEGSLCVDNTCVTSGPCTLGEDAATLQEAVDDVLCDIVEIPAGTFAVRDVTVGRTLVIRGAGAAQTTLDAEGLSRHLLLAAGTSLHLEGLRLIGGSATQGGSIKGESGADLTLEDVVFEGNEASEQGGAIHSSSGSIEGIGVAFVSNQVELDGSGSVDGGAIYALRTSISLEDCRFERNRAVAYLQMGAPSWFGASGGAIHTNASLNLDDCAFEENYAATGGPKGGNQLGGAIYTSSADTRMRRLDFHGNEAKLLGACGGSSCAGEGGALYQQGGTLDVESFQVVESLIETAPGAGLLRGGAFSLHSVATVRLVDGAFSDNAALGGVNSMGGAIYAYVRITDESGARHEIERVRFQGNQAACLDPACDANSDPNGGGGLYYQLNEGIIHLEMNRVLATGNAAGTPEPSTEPLGNGGFFGAFVQRGGAVLKTRIQNSTISGNRASGEGSVFAITGGATANGPGISETEIFNSTFSGNEGRSTFYLSVRSAEGLFSSVRFRNSVVEATGILCRVSPSVRFESGSWFVRSTDAGCGVWAGSGDLVTPDLGLLPLADNGGQTLTHALAPTSPLPGVGEPGGCTDGSSAITIDQRGATRTSENCTPGAYSD